MVQKKKPNKFIKEKGIADAFNEGVVYTKKLSSLKANVSEGREWGLKTRLSSILVSLFVGTIVGLVALSLLAAVEFFNSYWNRKINVSTLF